MAVVNRNSAQIADIVAVPRVPLNPVAGPSELKEVTGVVTPAADDEATSIGRFVRVPSNARISQVLISAADATTAGAIDVGVYQTADNGGAVVDADLFTSALDLANSAAAAAGNGDITHESGQYSFAESDNMLWEVLGLSVDPKIDYDIAYTITTTFNGGPTVIALKVRYVQ